MKSKVSVSDCTLVVCVLTLILVCVLLFRETREGFASNDVSEEDKCIGAGYTWDMNGGQCIFPTKEKECLFYGHTWDSSTDGGKCVQGGGHTGGGHTGGSGMAQIPTATTTAQIPTAQIPMEGSITGGSGMAQIPTEVLDRERCNKVKEDYNACQDGGYYTTA